jgi:Kef-type K+ transport system membrane component KefB
MALVMVGFLIGGDLAGILREHGRAVVWITIGKLIGTFVVLCAGMAALGVGWELALLLAAIATATDPAATADVVRESGADGPFESTLLGVVALDDAGGLILFSLVLAVLAAAAGASAGETRLIGARELVGAVVVGVCVGLPMAAMTGRIEPGEPTQIEALAAVFLCGGLASLVGASFLLSAVILGVVVAVRARHHRRPFREIEGVEWPFLVLFFVLAGASLDVGALRQVGWALTLYIALRVGGMTLGSWLGARIADAEPPVRRWMGVALLPQAGIALGMALVAARRFPEFGEPLLAVVIASTAIFEIVGPVFTRVALLRAGEASGAA